MNEIDRHILTNTNITEKSALIWNIADTIRGLFKPHEYGEVILPMTVVKRFHDTLLPTREAVLEEVENPSPQYLEILANYLILCMEKQERKENKIITENHLVTVNKRETSFEGLVSQFENGEDGIYNLMTKNKNIIFQPKKSITK